MDAASSPSSRDMRLDFWRGLCLIDMVLVHLVYERVQFGKWLTPVLGEYTRFAAGGFVFIAGMSIGAIFLPRLNDPAKRAKTYATLLRRARYILVVHFAATIATAAMDVLIGNRPPVESVPGTLLNIFLLREGSDLLPFYVIMLALSPVMLMLLRSQRWWVIVLASAACFVIGTKFPRLIALPLTDKFFPILWQAIFITGLLFGAAWLRFNQLSRRARVRLAGVSVTAMAIVCYADYASEFSLPVLRVPFDFHKTPLSLGELLRYLSIIFSLIFATDLIWHRLRDSRAVQFAADLGRRSLVVYVVHIWLVGWIAAVCWTIWWIGLWQILFAPLALTMLWLLVKTIDWFNAQPRSRLMPQLRFSLVGGALAACMLFGANRFIDRSTRPQAERILRIVDRHLMAVSTDSDDDPPPAPSRSLDEEDFCDMIGAYA